MLGDDTTADETAGSRMRAVGSKSGFPWIGSLEYENLTNLESAGNWN